MQGTRPEQAVLSKDTDLSKTAETKAVIEGMVDGLNDHRIDDIGQFFAESFRWMGNAGCGTKIGLEKFPSPLNENSTSLFFSNDRFLQRRFVGVFLVCTELSYDSRGVSKSH